MNLIEKRIAKLEEAANGTGDIPVWCDEERDTAATVSMMVMAGEISEAERGRCVHWLKARAISLCHEDALEQLQ